MSHQPVGTPCNCGLRGWMPGIEHIPMTWTLPSYIVRDAGKMKAFVVVDHIMQGFLTTMVAWASNGERKIIAHFGVSRLGRKVQFHDIYTEGIHATFVSSPTSSIVMQLGSIGGRGANPYSIGIEHEGFSVHPGHGHDFIYSGSHPWPNPMVESSIEIKRWIFDQSETSLALPSRRTIIGHYEIDATNRPHDPAPDFDRGVWPVDRMINELTGTAHDTYSDPDYTVIRPGEWLGRVSQRTRIPITELIALNNIADPNRVEAWQIIRLHSAVALPPTSPTNKDDIVTHLESALTLVRQLPD